ncbi:hypothetical protein BU14_0934s0002, partial [Porphyra umbilicalis]
MVKAERSPCVAILEAYGLLREAAASAAIAPASCALLLGRVAALLRGLRDLEAVPARVARFRVDTGAQWAIHEAIRSATAVVADAGVASPLAAVVTDRGVVGAAVARIAASVEAHAPLTPAGAEEVRAAVADRVHAAAAVDAHPLLGGLVPGGVGGGGTPPLGGRRGGGGGRAPRRPPTGRRRQVGLGPRGGRHGGAARPPTGPVIPFAELFARTYEPTAGTLAGTPVDLEYIAEGDVTPPVARALHARVRLRHPNVLTLYGVVAAPPPAVRAAAAGAGLRAGGGGGGGAPPLFASVSHTDDEVALALVSEASLDGGTTTLYEALAAAALDTAAKMRVLLDVASALVFLHSNGYAHGRLHPGVVVFASGLPGAAKLARPGLYPEEDGRGGGGGAGGGGGGTPTVGGPRTWAATSAAVAAAAAVEAGAATPWLSGGLGPAESPNAADGRRYYLAPEVAANGPPSAASDVWAFGQLAYALFAGRQPGAPPAVVDLIYGACLTAAPRGRSAAHGLLGRLVALRRSAPVLFGDGGPGGAATAPAPRTFERALGEHITDGGGVQAALRALYRLRFRGEPLSSAANLRAPGRVWAKRAAGGDADAAWNLHACYRRGHFVTRDLAVAMDWLVVARRADAAAAARAARGEGGGCARPPRRLLPNSPPRGLGGGGGGGEGGGPSPPSPTPSGSPTGEPPSVPRGGGGGGGGGGRTPRDGSAASAPDGTPGGGGGGGGGGGARDQRGALGVAGVGG